MHEKKLRIDHLNSVENAVYTYFRWICTRTILVYTTWNLFLELFWYAQYLYWRNWDKCKKSSTLLGTYSLDCSDTPSPSTLLGDYSLSRSDTPSAFTSESKINLTEELRIWLPHVNFGRLPQKQSRSPKPNQCTLSCSTQKCAAAFQGT